MGDTLTDLITLTEAEMRGVTDLSKHTLLQTIMSTLRDRRTEQAKFRQNAHWASTIVGVYVGNQIDSIYRPNITSPTDVEIDFATELNPNLAIASVMRAGNAMLEPFLELFASTPAIHIGMERNHETLEATTYCFKHPPDIGVRRVVMVDPMLATANSSIMAARKIEEAGGKITHFSCLIAAPYGIRKFREAFPHVRLSVGVIDKKLNENGYILPGLGDFGDRLYGT